MTQRTHLAARHWPTPIVVGFLIGIWAAILLLGLFGYFAINAYFASYTSCAELWNQAVASKSSKEGARLIDQADKRDCFPWR